MSILIDVLAVVLGVIGLIGCLLPVLPGPPLSCAGMMLMYFFGPEQVRDELSLKVLLIMIGVTIIVTVLDYIIPAYFTRLTGGSKAASRGALAGMILGLFVVPVIGMVAGMFIGAFLAELIIERKELKHSLKSAFGSFLGFLTGTGLKLLASGIMLYYIMLGIL